MKISSNVAGGSNDNDYNDNLSHKLLLTNIQDSRFREAFPSDSSANIKLSKT